MAAATVVAVFGIVSPQAAFAQNEPAGFRESFTLNANEAVVRRFQDVHDYIRNKRWEQAADLLLKIPQEHGDSLIAVRPGWYVNVTRYCNLLAASLPREGLDAYRGRIDRRAQTWLQDGQRLDDEQMIRRVVREAFCSSSGDEALLELARRAWQTGDVAAAKRRWQMLIPADDAESKRGVLRYPDANIDPALIRARLILCDLVAGKRDRAADALKAFQKQHPQASGRLAGKDGNLAEILAGERKSAAAWPKPQPADDVPTFAGNPARSGPPDADSREMISLGARRWSRELSAQPGGANGNGNGAAPHPAHHPVVWNDRVFYADAAAVYGFRLADGSPAFGPNDDGANAVDVPPERLYSISAEADLPAPTEPVVGFSQFTLTVHAGRLYARLGSPITGRAADEVRAVRSSLVCLDLERGEGKLQWKLDSRSLGDGWEFEGPPIVQGSRLYVALRRRTPETQIHVACFDADDAKLLWTTRVGTAIAVGNDEKNHVSCLLLTLAEGRLFLSTNLGAVAAIDAGNGRLDWAATYAADSERDQGHRNSPPETGPTPCLFHDGTVYVAPADAGSRVLAIHAETGRVRWVARVRGGVRALLSVRGNRLVASGNRLWGIDTTKGTAAWNLGFEDPAGYGFGRGVVVGKRVVWPLRKELLVADCNTGRIEERIAIHQLRGGLGGNLLVADRRLIVAEPKRLCVYGERPGGQPAGGRGK